MQALQVRLARAAGNGSLVAGLEAASAFVPGQSGGPTGLMITLRARSMDDLAAFALGQVCRLSDPCRDFARSLAGVDKAAHPRWLLKF
jgi:hypothetical protein